MIRASDPAVGNKAGCPGVSFGDQGVKARVNQLKGDVMTDSRDRENGGPKMDRRGALECNRLGANRLLCGSRLGRADNLGFIPRADPHAFAAVMPLDILAVKIDYRQWD